MNEKKEEISSLQLNDELIKYYDDLIKQIKLDFNNGLYEQAINRCEEELEQPYLPFEYIVEFEKLAHNLETEYRYKQIDNNYLKKLSIIGSFFWLISSKSSPYEFNRYYTFISIGYSLFFLSP